MSKFPDPTKNYDATPVDPNKPVVNTPTPTEVPVYQAPDPTPRSEGETPNTAPPGQAELGRAPDQYVSPSPFRNLIPILIALGVIIVLVVGAMSIIPRLTKKTTNITLTYWGLWEPSSVMQAVIADYQNQNPNIKIEYTMQSPKNYRSRLQSAINSGTAPDIARIHNTWLPMLKSSLITAPDTIIPVSLLDSYYPVVKKNVLSNGKIYARPRSVDGLALLYNQDMLSEEGATPPSDWNTFRKLAYDLTRTNKETGVIERAGAAMGTTGNVEHWSDILALLILQNSGDPGKPTTPSVQEALTFFTIFSSQDKSWDSSQPNSVYAFATGSVAMILAPSWQIAEIKAINPDLKFGVAPAPTLPSTKIAWASYWMEAVPKTSKNSEEAWKFIKFLASEESLQKIYAGATQVHGIAQPYPLTKMSTLISSDPIIGSYISQAPNYLSWYLTSRTYDEGINDQLIKYYEDAVNEINNGSTVDSVMKTLDSGVTQILAKFPDAAKP
ncbi:MAG: extracellular solute-binding protein [Candidatus Moraniibacteriota bacterium]|nr:MAG: extracellular solute-binding protein [Candidatus Moranbacteria bacterium]